MSRLTLTAGCGAKGRFEKIVDACPIETFALVRRVSRQLICSREIVARSCNYCPARITHGKCRGAGLRAAGSREKSPRFSAAHGESHARSDEKKMSEIYPAW